ncbi:hypothetical protein SUGI_0498410 [Cryptomeria japonica]|uniref:uncharacterized protein LOC131062041 n=1 Tax=Cryptomeria japonica TaxID=3369 RepID=UPI002408B8D4|nr:uncharacterized protein LOC131062041 [Cryptomeria japonica]XP_057851858.1 uncharacterized protein LOC131062041 [Cryptomeria japonica]XP_059077431.1 uncharacterized protein LOC131062041 [Cryptomeria japonica]GLJ25985.1 hypothetical protein SUGI_0498410 [Cryptomeria japonica]
MLLQRSLSVESTLEEALGPSAAIPFKWEEAPGKAKPEEEQRRPAVLQMKGDNDFYNLLLSKQESMGHSTRSLYRPADPGTVPFQWEAEPGRPKTPARMEQLAPLSPPPALLSPARPASPIWGVPTTKWYSQNLMKKIFHRHHQSPNKVSLDSNPGASNSQVSRASRSSGSSSLLSFSRMRSSNGGSELSATTTSSSSSSSCSESPRKELSSQGTGSWLYRSAPQSPNLYHCDPKRHHKENKDTHERKSTEESEEDLEFHDALSKFFNSAEMRFSQVSVGRKQIIDMHGYKIPAAMPRGFLSCLPLFSLLSRRPKIYEDCIDSH